MRMIKSAAEGVAEVKRESTLDVVKSLKRRGYRLYLLIEDGEDIGEVVLEPNCAFILGDQVGFPSELEETLRSLCHNSVSLGRRSYLASHCIMYLHEMLDRHLPHGGRAFAIPSRG